MGYKGDAALTVAEAKTPEAISPQTRLSKECALTNPDTRELLAVEAADLTVVFRAKGVKREDGLTAAEVETLQALEN